MWPRQVVVLNVLVQDPPEVAFVGDQQPVQGRLRTGAHRPRRDRPACQPRSSGRGARGASGRRSPDCGTSPGSSRNWEDPDEALDRAVVLHYAYIGYLQMAHVAPDVINEDGRGRQLELVFNALVTGEVPPKSVRRMRQEAAVAQSRGAGTVNQSARHHGSRRAGC